MTDRKDTFKTLWQEMSSEEKKAAMEKIMGDFFSGMKEDKKQGFMQGMMGEIMGKTNFNPMEMMSKMMGNEGKEGGFNPMEMCGKMMSFMQENRKISTLATPEVQGLFEDWVEQIEEEIIEFVKDKKDVNVDHVSGQFKISKNSAYYFLTQLAKKGKIDLKFDEKAS